MDKGVEGIVSKLRDAPYRPGSRPEWLKIKCPGWTTQNRDRWEKLRG
jgi:ATP-dependent DNA ligase